MRPNRRLCCVTLVGLSLVSGGTRLVTADESLPLDKQKCSLKVRHRRLRTVVSRLLKGTGVTARFQDNVPNVHITVRFEEVSIQQGLRLIVRTTAKQVPDLTLSKDGDEFTIAIRKPVKCFPILEPGPPRDLPLGGNEGSLR